MKLTVITGRGGKIVGTAHCSEGDPVAGQGGPVAGPHQTAHVIDDLPRELQKLKSAEELHGALKAHLPGRAKKR